MSSQVICNRCGSARTEKVMTKNTNGYQCQDQEGCQKLITENQRFVATQLAEQQAYMGPFDRDLITMSPNEQLLVDFGLTMADLEECPTQYRDAKVRYHCRQAHRNTEIYSFCTISRQWFREE